MAFLASLAIKTLIGTSICGAVTVGTIYKCDRTLLGFSKDDPQNLTDSLGKSGGDEIQKDTRNTSNDASSVNSVTPGKDTNIKSVGDESGKDKDAEAKVQSLPVIPTGDVGGKQLQKSKSEPEAQKGDTQPTDVKSEIKGSLGGEQNLEESVAKTKEELKLSENNADDTDPTSTIESNSGTQSEPKTSTTKPAITTVNNGEGSVAGTDETNLNPQKNNN